MWSCDRRAALGACVVVQRVRSISWGQSARVCVDGPRPEVIQRVAGRWCGSVDTTGIDADEQPFRLVVPELDRAIADAQTGRIRLGVRVGTGHGVLELRVGPHSVVIGGDDESDIVRFSDRRVPTRLEYELVIDMGVNHLLARQGLPVLHSCSFELGGASILGLGESFSGKTTVSVAAMRAGGRVASDDVVLVVGDEGGSYSLLPVRSYGWLRGKTREIVPDELLEKMRENREDGQPRWVLQREDAGESFVDRLVPDVVWVQSVDRRLKESRIEPISQGQVFAALIRASSPLYLSRHCPEIRDKLIPVFRSLCEQCRGYRVRLAPRLLEEPEREMKRLVDLSRLGSSDRMMNDE